MATNPDNVVSLRSEAPAFYPALIPEGEYCLMLHRSKILTRFNRGVLELWFAVYDPNYGEHHGKQIVRYYNVQVSTRRRSFTASPGSDFVRDYAAVSARDRDSLTRLSMRSNAASWSAASRL